MRTRKLNNTVNPVQTEAFESTPVGAYPSEEKEDSSIAPTETVLQSEDTVDMNEAEMPPTFARIITYQFRPIDEEKEYHEIRTWLTSGGRLSALQFGELVDALDKAQDYAHRAAELASRTHLIHERYMFDLDLVESALRQAAIKKLEAQKTKHFKETETKGKQITNKDVETYIVAFFPDESASIEKKKTESKEMVSLVDDLQIRAAERAKDLRAVVTRTRAVD